MDHRESNATQTWNHASTTRQPLMRPLGASSLRPTVPTATPSSPTVRPMRGTAAPSLPSTQAYPQSAQAPSAPTQAPNAYQQPTQRQASMNQPPMQAPQGYPQSAQTASAPPQAPNAYQPPPQRQAPMNQPPMQAPQGYPQSAQTASAPTQAPNAYQQPTQPNDEPHPVYRAALNALPDRGTRQRRTGRTAGVLPSQPIMPRQAPSQVQPPMPANYADTYRETVRYEEAPAEAEPFVSAPTLSEASPISRSQPPTLEPAVQSVQSPVQPPFQPMDAVLPNEPLMADATARPDPLDLAIGGLVGDDVDDDDLPEPIPVPTTMPIDLHPRKRHEGLVAVLIVVALLGLVAALYLTGLLDGLLNRAGLSSVTTEANRQSSVPSVFLQAPAEGGGGITPASATAIPELKNSAVEPLSAAIPATITLTLDTNAETTAVRLLKQDGTLLKLSGESAPSGDGLRWTFEGELTEPYTGVVRVFLRDADGSWSEGGQTPSITFQ